MSEFLKNFGKKILYYRKLKNISQEKLAELIGVSTNSITALENGRNFIKYKNLVLLCKALGISENALFDFPMSKSKYSSTLKEINARVKLLTPAQQEQILNIINTFK